jgi:hypothetical protein
LCLNKHYHSWSNSPIYDITCIVHNSACSNKYHLRKKLIICGTTTWNGFIPLAIQTYGCAHSHFSFFFLLFYAHAIIVHHYQSYLFLVMLIFIINDMGIKIPKPSNTDKTLWFFNVMWTLETLFIFSTNHNYCTFIIRWFVIDDTFLITIFYFTNVLVVSWLLSSFVICVLGLLSAFVLLMDGFPSLPFLYTQGFYSNSWKGQCVFLTSNYICGCNVKMICITKPNLHPINQLKTQNNNCLNHSPSPFISPDQFPLPLLPTLPDCCLTKDFNH